MRGALQRDRCAVVKPFSAGVDPVTVGILTIALAHFHDIVRFTLVSVVVRQTLTLAVHKHKHIRPCLGQRQSKVLPRTFIGAHPIAIREALDIQHPVGEALSVNEYVRDSRIRRSSCSLCLPACLETWQYEQLLFREKSLQFHLHPHSALQHASL